jgi:hypothetical protein
LESCWDMSKKTYVIKGATGSIVENCVIAPVNLVFEGWAGEHTVVLSDQFGEMTL